MKIRRSENQIPASQIHENGKVSVGSGQSFISGYSRPRAAVINSDLPMIIIGDHTRAVKFVDFPCSFGADGTMVVAISARQLFDAQYLRQMLMRLGIYYYFLIYYRRKWMNLLLALGRIQH